MLWKLLTAPYGRNFGGSGVGTCERHAQGRYSTMRRPAVEPATSWLQVQYPNHNITEPQSLQLQSNRDHQQTNNQLLTVWMRGPVAQPTASRHWRQKFRWLSHPEPICIFQPCLWPLEALDYLMRVAKLVNTRTVPVPPIYRNKWTRNRKSASTFCRQPIQTGDRIIAHHSGHVRDVNRVDPFGMRGDLRKQRPLRRAEHANVTRPECADNQVGPQSHWRTSVSAATEPLWTKHSEETQTLRAGCSKAKPKYFATPQTPLPQHTTHTVRCTIVQEGLKIISWPSDRA